MDLAAASSPIGSGKGTGYGRVEWFFYRWYLFFEAIDTTYLINKNKQIDRSVSAEGKSKGIVIDFSYEIMNRP